MYKVLQALKYYGKRREETQIRSLLIAMSASGTMMLFIVGIACFLCGNLMTAKWKRALLMIVIAFYVLPIPDYKYEIIWRTEKILGHDVFSEISLEGKLNNDYMIIHTQDQMVIGDKQRLVVIFFIVSVAIAVILIWHRIHAYFSLKKQIDGYDVHDASGEASEAFAHIKKELRIRREVKLYQSSDLSSPIAIGIFRPAVWLPEGEHAGYECKGVLYHELAHISHHDLLFYCIGIGTVALHWFNPCCYLLLPLIRLVNEQYSDETAVAHLTRAERIHYCEMLIQAAGNYTETPDMELGFSSGKRMIKRRIQRIMATKKRHVMFAAVAGLIGCVLSTGVALAYEEPRVAGNQIEEYTTDVDANADEFFYFDSDVTADDIPYDDFFVDENGQIYDTGEQGVQPHVVCTQHLYVSGTHIIHRLDGNGGCITKYYHAKRCQRCGYMVTGDLYRTVTETVCTHSS